MLKPIKKNPPIRFIKEQLVLAIANRTTDLIAKQDKGEITQLQFNTQVFPADAFQVIDKAIASAIELYNTEENNDES